MSTTAMFIYGGFRDVLNKQPNGDEAHNICEVFCYGGELEAVENIELLAEKVDAAVTPLLAEKDGPGVWYYDVAEPLGTFIAEAAASGIEVTFGEAVDKAVELTNEWLREVNQ